jgi:putative protein kinase ArgK-like GTPase of G3E family
VMLASALTGAGVADLLAALDRRDEARRQALASGTPDPAQLARAEAQLTGTLSRRLAELLREPSRAAHRSAAVRAIAAHETDPYAAADRLLGLLSREAKG